jgi:hypothetical protein
MQKRNERKNVGLLGFLEVLAMVIGNDPPSPSFGAAWGNQGF